MTALAELHHRLPGAGRLGSSGFRARCPAHGGKTASLSVAEASDGRLLVRCHAGCETNDVLRALGMTMRDLFACDRQPPAPLRAAAPKPITPESPRDEALRRKRELAAMLWRQAAPIQAETPPHAYLLGRGCAIPPRDGDLRWLPDLRLFGFEGPALLGRISLATDARRGIGLHVTWLALEGGRWRRTERRILGAKAGGVVRLWPDEAVTYSAAVAEGVESALAMAHVHSPVWATIDAGNLREFPVLRGVETLVIAADRDRSGTGQRAAAECAQRWLEAGRKAIVLAAADVGRDVADVMGEAACYAQ